MVCYSEFPVSTVVYNWVTAGGVMALGVAVAVQFGVGALVTYALLLMVALVGILVTVCARCESYYGHRCGLGLGTVVPLLHVVGAQAQLDPALQPPVGQANGGR